MTNATVVPNQSAKSDFAYNHDVVASGADETVDTAYLLGISTSGNTKVDYFQVANKGLGDVSVVIDGATTTVAAGETRAYGKDDSVALTNDFTATVPDGTTAVFSWDELA